MNTMEQKQETDITREEKDNDSRDNYKLSELLACMAMRESIPKGNKQSQPKSLLIENLHKINNYYKDAIGVKFNATIKHTMKNPKMKLGQQHSADRIRKIYRNICNDKSLTKALLPLTNLTTTMTHCMDTESNLVEFVFGTRHTHCDEVHDVANTYRNKKGRR